MNQLQLCGVTKRYGRVQALAGVDLAVPPGSRTAVVGPSGSGKTTLLRLIAGFEVPDAGEIRLGDAVLAGPSGAVPAHKRGVGIVAQDGALFPHLSVAGNIGFGLGDAAGRECEVLRLMDSVELARSMAERRPHELSGGQQQRVALARALARRPALLLLDEPFSALDAGLRQSIRDVVGRVLTEAGVASVMVTHDRSEALSFADQVAVMRDGRFVQVGAPQEVYWRPADPDTAAFLGDAVILRGVADQGVVRCALGLLDAASADRSGPVSVLLRPAQIEFGAIDPPPHDAGTRPAMGRVRQLVFEGGHSTVTVEILDDFAGADEAGVVGLLQLSCPSHRAPAPGARVAIRVVGPAHVFASTPGTVGLTAPPRFE